MFNNAVENFETLKQKIRLIEALNSVCVARPYLSGLASLVKIYVSNMVDSAGITATGKLLINPQFLDQLTNQELAFVIAHEFMHLVLQTHERAGNLSDNKLINIAHDFIINDDLMEDFADGLDRPPTGGLHWPDYIDRIDEWKPASEYSLEELVYDLRRQNIAPKKSWNNGVSNTSSKSDRPLSGGGGCGSLGDLLKEAGINPPKTNSQSNSKSKPNPNSRPNSNTQPANSSDTNPENKQNDALEGIHIKNKLDVLSAEDELNAFPNLSPESRAREQKSVQQVAIRSYSEAVLLGDLNKNEKVGVGKGNELGSGYGMFDLLRGCYTTPWEAALQRWFDTVAPGVRSFAKASRRGAWRTDVVLPGRKREGWTLHIVLDTSGSMTRSLRRALGAIESFCQNNYVETIHILQCDAGVTADEWIEVGNLEKYQAKGFGGSDMSPAMLKLAEDPDVTAVIVLTDGWIDYPKKEPPYETLWAIVDRGRTHFKYGTAIRIEFNEK